jgi:ADP-ribosylglycohydrolase
MGISQRILRLRQHVARPVRVVRETGLALLAANLGNDADTTGAIFGQLGGAFHGESAIPQGWLEKLAMRELIREMAVALVEFSYASGTHS